MKSKSRTKEPKAQALDAHVGSRVRLRRTLLGMSQEKLAESLGITFQQVQKYERGVNRVGASRLYDLSRILDVPVGFFFEGAGFPVKPSRGATRSRAMVASPKAAYDAGDMSDRETLELVRAFKSIRNPSMRKSVLDMIRSLSKKGTVE